MPILRETPLLPASKMKTGIGYKELQLQELKEEKSMGFAHGNSFALVVVLFILLIIVGAACFC